MKFYSILFVGMTLLLSCNEGNNRQEAGIDSPEEVKAAQKTADERADVSFKDGMTGKVFHNYLEVKMALVNSDPDAASTAAGNMAESFGPEHDTLKSLAIKIEQAGDIEEQRKFFYEFSKEVEPLISASLSGGNIYKHYCPMAFNNEGAFWLADVKEIRNPYFGEKMLTCGRIEKTLTSN